jgi:thiol-disulfide isomerase/thioredoxin
VAESDSASLTARAEPVSAPLTWGDRAFIVGRMALLIGIALALAWPYLSPAPPLAVGLRAPVVHAQSYDGRTWDLERFSGTPVFVNFFGSWCPPCVAEMPDLVATHSLYGDRIAFVGLAVESPREDVFAFIRRFDVAYAIAATDATTVRAWSATSLPSSFLLDADHRVVWSSRGQVSKKELVGAIEQHLSTIDVR